MLKIRFVYEVFIFLRKVVFVFVMFLLFSNDVQSAGISSKFVNIVVDDGLYYPLNLLMNKFAKDKNLILNIKYVNKDFYKTLSYDEKISVFVTQKSNRTAIEKYFNIKFSNFFGMVLYAVCINKNSDVQYKNIKSLSDLEASDSFQNVGIGSNNSTFFLDRKIKLKPGKNVTEYSDALSAVQDLYSNMYDAGIFLYSMCDMNKGLVPVYIVDMEDGKNKNQSMIDYRVYVVNHMNENVQSFVSFFNNSSEIYDLLKDYGIIGKSRQFSQK